MLTVVDNLYNRKNYSLLLMLKITLTIFLSLAAHNEQWVLMSTRQKLFSFTLKVTLLILFSSLETL